MNTTSLTLLERLKQQHDDAAWSRLVELYTPMLFHWSRRTGLTETESEDLVQDVFLALLAKLSSFDRQQEGSFRKWLKVVTVNKCRERFRRRQFPVASGHGDFDPLNAVADPTTIPRQRIAGSPVSRSVLDNNVNARPSESLHENRETSGIVPEVAAAEDRSPPE